MNKVDKTNYNVLFMLRTTEKVAALFTNIFVSMYFLDISDGNILNLSLFHIAHCSFIFIIMFLCRNILKSKYRRYMIYIGKVFQLLYLFLFVFLKEGIVNYSLLVGTVLGLSEGTYFGAYNIWETEGISYENRKGFLGRYNIVKGIISIIFPICSGWIIYRFGFSASAVIVIFATVISIMSGFFYSDTINDTIKTKVFNLLSFLSSARNEKRFKDLVLAQVGNGLTYSSGAFSLVITLYTIRVYNTSIKLGIITTIVNIFTILLGFVMKSKLNKKAFYMVNAYCLITGLLVFFFIVMIINPNYITIPIFKLCTELHDTLGTMEDSVAYANIVNKSEYIKPFVEEYVIFMELVLFVSRVVGFILLIIYALTNVDFILWMFIVFVLLQTVELSKSYIKTF